jgi:hypothetical protein
MAHLAEKVSSKDDLGAIAMLNLYAWGAAREALGLDQQTALALARSPHAARIARPRHFHRR